MSPVVANHRRKEYFGLALRTDNFYHVGDVHIRGDVSLTGCLLVAGNLTVNGNLQAETILCTGNVTAGLDMDGSDFVVGGAVHSGGPVKVAKLRAGYGARIVACMIEKMDHGERDGALARFCKQMPLVREAHLNFGEQIPFFAAIRTDGDVTCALLESNGAVALGGALLAEEVCISGDLEAAHIKVKEKLHVSEGITCQGDIQVSGKLSSDAIRCGGSLECGAAVADYGDITVAGHTRVHGDIVAKSGSIDVRDSIISAGRLTSSGYVKAGRFIIAEKGVESGDDYGIIAGCCVPKTKWPEQGYICTPAKPANMLCGVHKPRKTRQEEMRHAAHKPSTNSVGAMATTFQVPWEDAPIPAFLLKPDR